MARIVGSDIAHAVPLTLVAGIGHWAMGAIDWQLMGVLLVGSLPGIILGSYCATRVPETALRLLLAATLLVVAGKLGSERMAQGAADDRGFDPGQRSLKRFRSEVDAASRKKTRQESLAVPVGQKSRKLANSAKPNSAIAPTRNPEHGMARTGAAARLFDHHRAAGAAGGIATSACSRSISRRAT